jgi:ribonuclease HII
MGALFKLENPKKLAASTLKQQMLRQLICSDAPEQALRYRGHTAIAGIDEVGRGALFGPVVAAAVILPKALSSLAKAGLTDSKQLTREDRERLDRKIRKLALSISIAEIDAETIDRVNIYQATRLAMMAAIDGLHIAPDHLLIDAMRLDHPCPQTRLFYGDSLSLSIAAASVIAKVHRDNLCRQLDAIYPQYGLASHKGYATPVHRKALRDHGPCALHRRSFAPVRASDPDAALELELESGELFLDDILITDTNPIQEAAWA